MFDIISLSTESLTDSELSEENFNSDGSDQADSDDNVSEGGSDGVENDDNEAQDDEEEANWETEDEVEDNN